MVPTQYCFALSLLVLFPFFHFGYDVAFFRSAKFIGRDLDLTDIHEHNVVYVPHRFCIPTSFVAGILLNYVGRRAIILLGFCFYIVGALVSSTGWAYEVVMTGRVLMGLSLAFGLTSGPIYVSEIAPAAHRGLLVSLSQLLFTAGMMLGWIAQHVAKAHLSTHSSWRLVTGIGAIPCLFLLVGVGCLPSSVVESPCWLIIRGKLAEANTVMERCGIQRTERRARQNQLTYIVRTLPALIASGSGGGGGNGDVVQVPSIFATLRPMWEHILVPTSKFFRTFVTVSALHAFQSLSGADFAIWFGRTYFDNLGSGPESLKEFVIKYLIGMGMRMVVSLFPIFMVDRIGRRWVLLVSLTFIICATGIFGGVSVAGNVGAVGKTTASVYCLSMIIFMQAGHALGLGVVPWVYGPESFDFWVRGPAVGMAAGINREVAWIVQKKLIEWYFKIDIGGIYLVCCGIMVVAFVCCLVFVKDRRGYVLVD